MHLDVLSAFLLLLWLTAAIGATLWGLDYYLLPVGERAYSPHAEMFAPTGLVGHGLGILGSAMMLFGVVMYSARKRVSRLAGLGKLRNWLRFHIFLCTLGPFFVLLHTTFKFGGIVSISFWSMTIVVISGVFGRYVYVRIPKTLNGRFHSLSALEQQRSELTSRLVQTTGLDESLVTEAMQSSAPSKARGLIHAIWLAARYDLQGRSRRRRVGKLLSGARLDRDMTSRAGRLVREQSQLESQIVLLQPFQRLFRYWHVLHLPLATLMFVILAVHVAVAVLFGYTWVF